MASRRIPKRVSVGAYVFGVHVGGPAFDRLLAYHREQHGDDADLHAIVDTDNTVIALHPAQSADLKREKLLHEVLHAAFFAAGGFPGGDDEQEEAVVRTLSPLLIEVLRDNPALVAYLRRE